MSKLIELGVVLQATKGLYPSMEHFDGHLELDPSCPITLPFVPFGDRSPGFRCVHF